MDTTYLLNTFLTANPSLQDLYNDFQFSLISAHRAKERLCFLKTCLQEHVIPKSLLPKRLENMDNQPFGEYEHLTLDKCIKKTKEEVFDKFKVSNNHKECLMNVLTKENQHIVFSHCYRMLTTEMNKKKRKHEEKVKGLIENSCWNKNVNPDCVVNLSSKVLDHDTLCALGYGLTFAYGNKINPIQVGKSLFHLKKVSQENSDLVRGIIYGSMFKKNRNSIPARFIKAINNLKKDDTLHITKADKSNAIVIMDK